MPTRRSRLPLCAAAALALLCAAATAADDCVHLPDPAAGLTKAAATAAGPAVDIGNVTVIELDGDYSKDNDAPRMAVARRFYETHPDRYDFLVVFTTFEFETGDARAFHNLIRNDTQGIGRPAFDLGQPFGSAARLQGYIDMAAMSRNSFVSSDAQNVFLLRTFAHELMHRWGSHLSYRTDGGETSRALFGYENSHWSYFLDSDASLMLGNDWRRRDDGRYESVAIRQRFSALDLYVAGFAAASEVPPMTLIQGGDGAATALPRLGAISGGSGETVRIEQIIAAEGARVPDAAHSPKDFRAALILLKRPGETLPATTLPALENARVRMQQYFNQVTEGRASVRLFNEPLQAAAPQLPTILSGSAAAATPPGVTAAVDWIKQRQLSDGHWQDRAATALRDTTTALQLLQQVEPGWSGLAAARSWIAAQQPTSFDAQSWKLQADPQAGVDSLLAAQSADGGWGIAAGFADANLDTAGVAEVLAQRDANTDSLRRALLQLGSRQNADGSFAVGASGRGRLLPTLRAARLFAASTQPGHQTVRDAATQWIAARQRADGAFADAGTRNDESALADTIELYRLVGRLPLPVAAAGNARDYVIGAQRSAGDWQGSVYLTARAALAQLYDNKANLAAAGAASVMPADPVEGDVLTVRVRVANTGSLVAPASVARWYDGDPDAGGTLIGTDQTVPALSAGTATTLEQQWDSAGRPGARTLWLVLDADGTVAEQNESDNRVAIPVAIGPAPALPDIALDATRLTLNPAAVASLPSTVELSGDVRNLGSTPVTAARLVLYDDTDTPQVLAATTLDLPARGAAPLQLTFTATRAATLRLRLVADPDGALAEARENNNDAQLLLPFGPSLDLEVRDADLALLDTTPPTQGHDVGFRVQVRNRGTLAALDAPLRITLRQGASEDTLFDSRVALEPGRTIERRVYWRARQPGAATLRVQIDPGGEIAELDENNNLAELPFTVAAQSGSDLAVVADSLQFLPSPALQGQPLQLTLRLRNAGAEAAGPFTVALFASEPRSGGLRLAQTALAGLAAQTETTATLDVADLALAGDTSLFVVVDADQSVAEADETNNVAQQTLNVLPFADIAVASAGMQLLPSAPAPGAALEVRAVVRNLGAQTAHDVRMRLFEGSAETGVAVGADQVVAELAAGAEATVSWNWTFGLQPGARQLTLVADPANTVRENQELNNLAILPLTLQESGFYASERHFSPNGDGVRDATALYFARSGAGRIDVAIRNAAGRVVRRYDDVAAADAASGQLVWDGRDERGRVVADGVYIAELRTAGSKTAELALTLDTDRSSLVAAIGTPLLADTKLPDGYSWFQPPAAPATRDLAFARDFSPSQQDFRSAIYRADRVTGGRSTVLSSSWFIAHVRHDGADIDGTLGAIDAESFSPDGRWIAFYIRNGERMELLVAAADQTDRIVLLDGNALPLEFQYDAQPPRFLDATHLIAGAWPQLSVYDLQTQARVDFRAVPGGRDLLAFEHGIYVWTSGRHNPPAFYVPRDAGKPIVAFDGPTPLVGANLSEDGTRAVLTRYSPDHEAVSLFRTDTGSETVLLQRTPQPHAFAGVEAPGHRRSLQAQWIAADDSVLVVDALERRVAIHTRDGVVRRQITLPAVDGALDLGPDPQHFSGEHRRVNVAFSGDECDGHRVNCLGAVWAAGNRREQWFDPLTRRAVVLLPSEYAGRVSCEVGLCVGYAPATLEAFAVDLDDGSFQRVAAMQRPQQIPADLQPRLRLLDGAALETDGRYRLAGGSASAQPWLYADADSVRLYQLDDNDDQLIVPRPPGQRSVSGLVNLAARIWAEPTDRAIALSGIAADLNFAGYQLDWASPSAPTQWHAITPRLYDPVVADEFLTWIPPQPGRYLVRLSVFDKAGNATTQTTSTLSQFGSPISDFGIDERYVSPNGDGIKDTLTARFTLSAAAQVAVRVLDGAGHVVRADNRVRDAGLNTFVWDGRDGDGAMQPDGAYVVDVGGLRYTVHLDTAAPSLQGWLRQPNLSTAADGEKPYAGPVEAVAAGADTNLARSAIELRERGTDLWREVDLGDVAVASLRGYGALAGKDVREVAYDRAGNRAARELGAVVEQLLFADCGRNPAPPCDLVHTVDAIGGTMTPTYAADFPDAITVVTDPAHFDVSVIDASAGISAIELEIADARRPGEWQLLATMPVQTPADPVARQNRLLDLRLPLQGLPLGADRRLRLVGLRGDASRLYGDQLRVLINGLGDPIVLCPGRDPSTMPPAYRTYVSLDNDAVQVVVPVYVPNATADVRLQLGRPPGGQNIAALFPQAHFADATVFRVTASTLAEYSGLEARPELVLPIQRLLAGKVTDFRACDLDSGGGSGGGVGGLQTAAPVPGEVCAATPSHRVALNAFAPFADISHYQLRIGRVADAPETLLDIDSPPNHPVPGSAWQWHYLYELATQQRPENSYFAASAATAYGGVHVGFDRTGFHIDHDAPQVEWLWPAPGSRVCAVSSRGGLPLLDLGGTARSDSPTGVQIELKPHGTLDSERCLDSTLSDRACPTPRINELADRFGNIRLQAQGPAVVALNGLVDAQLRVMNWSGGVTCANAQFYLDSTVELGLAAAPEPEIAVGRLAGPDVAVDDVPVLGVSTAGAARFRNASVDLIAREPLRVRATLHRVVGEGRHYTLQEEMATLLQSDAVEGRFQVSWNGRIGGAPAADGVYAVRIAAEDDCGWTAARYVLVEADSTPPTVAITDPLAGTVPTDAVVAISGTVADAHFSSFSTDQPFWELAVEQAGQTQLVGQGEDAVPQPAVLGRWSRGTAQQAGNYQLVAADDFGNRSEITVSFAAPTPLALLVRAQLLPELFSPNGDGRLDRSELRIDLLAPALVDLRIRNDGGAVVATLAQATAMPAGTTRLDWNGSGLPDGNYEIDVVAQSAATPELRETALLAAVLDTRAPQLSVLTPAGDVAGAAAAVTFRIDEAYPDRFDARLLTDSGAIQAQLAGGGGGVQTLASLNGRADGRYRIAIQAQDRAGNRSDIEQRFVLDTTAPQAALTAPIDDSVLPRGGAAVRIAGTATDAQFESYAIELLPGSSQNGLQLASGSSAVEAAELGRWTVSEADGDYRLRLRVRDRAGNESTAERRIAIDGTPPQVVIDTPADGAALAGRLRLLGTVQDAHLRDYVVAIATPGAALADNWTPLYRGLAPVTAGMLADVDLPLPDGDYVLRVLATDATGATASARRDLRIDKAPPPAPLQLRVQVNGADAVLDWSPPAAGDLAGYAIYRNGARLNPTVHVTPHYVDTPLPDGRWRYQVTALDQAGNESATSNAVEIDVDRTPPTVEVHAPLTGARVHGVVPVIATAHSAEDFDSFVLTARRRDGGDTPRVLAQGSLPQRNQLLAHWDSLGYAENTTVVLRLSARDRSGNEAVREIELVVDNLAPAAPQGLVATLQGNDAALAWDANGEADLLGYLLYRNGQLVNGPTPLPADLRGFALQANRYLDAAPGDGTHGYVVFAIDQAGNISAASAPASIGPLDNGPPHLSIDAPEAGTAFETRIDVRASSRDRDIASVQFAYRAAGTNDWTAIGAALSEAPYRLSWTPGNRPHGEYEIRALATDTGGRSDPQPPQVLVRYADLTPPAPAGALQATADGGTVQLSWSASASDDVVAYRIERYDGSAWQLVIDTNTTTASDGGLSDGRWTYRVRAQDAGGNLSTERSDDAEVFSLQLQAPFTPTDAATTSVQGRSARAGQLALRRGDDAEQNAGATAADGRFTLDALALGAGSNRFTVRVTSAAGDRSRTATASVRRSDAPAAPTGLQAAVSGHVVDLAWNANTESDLLGYRVQHNGGYVQADDLATGLAADSIVCCDAAHAADGNPATAWDLTTTFEPLAQDGATDPPLEIDLGTAQIVSALELDWDDADTASGNVDLYARSEYGDWLRLVRLRRSNAASYVLSLPQPYRSDRLRLVVRAPDAAGSYAHLRLAEVRVRSWHLQSATALQQTVLDGTHRYRVAAVNAAAQQSAWSAPAEVGIGDTTPPDAVVLSGALQDDTATLSWTASVAADVARYVLTRNGVTIADVAASGERRHVDAHLPLGSYAYEVVAYDAFDNPSLPSNRVNLTVSGSGPGIPTALTVVAPPQGRSLAISWNAGAGSAPVRYLLRRATATDGPYTEIATPGSTNVSDAPLVDGTRYYYTVEAIDVAGNRSGASAPVSGVPRDTLPPTPPVLTYPVAADGTLRISGDRSLVCGRAEPGSAVQVQRDGVAAGTVTAATTADVTNYIATGTYLYSWLQIAADGWHLLDGGNGLRLVDLRSGQTETEAGDIRLAQWSVQGLTAYYLQDGRLRAKSPGRAAEILPLQAEEIRNFAVPADDSRVLLLGRFANGTASAVDGLWWLRRDGSDAGLVGGFAGRVPDPDQPLLLRPDGRYAAVRADDAQLLLIDLATLRVIDAFAADLNIAPRWMADGNLAFTRSDGVTITLWRYDVIARRADPSFALPGFTQGLAWAPDGSEFAVYGNARVQGRDVADGNLHFDLTLPAYDVNLATFAWAPTGRIVFVGSDGSYPPRLYSVQPPGAFCAGPLALQAGSNRIAATAADPAGNRSDLSRPIRIDVDGTALPDPAIAAADVFLLPATPAPGQPVTALATVRNRGAAAANAVAVAAELLAPDGSRRTLAVPAPSNLAAGEARSLSLDLGVLDQTGYYRLRLVVDPAAQIIEADESNNTVELPFAVSGGSDPLLDVSVENRLLAPGERLRGEARVTNPGNPFNGRVHARVLAADGSLVADLGDANVTALAGGQVWTRALDWDSRSTLAGDYRMQAQLLRSDGSVLTQRETAFTIAAVRRIALAVTATPAPAAIGAAVAIDSRLHFETGNALLSGAVLRTAVRNPAGAEVWSATQPLGTVQPGYQLSKVDTWNTQAAAAGVHTIRLELSAPGITQSSEASLTLFEPAAPVALRGSLGLTPVARLVAGQPGELAYRIDNAGAAALNGLSLRLRVLRTTSPPQPVFEREELVDLGAGSSREQRITLAAPPLALDSYVAVLDARLAGDAPDQWRDLARASFVAVDETPPDITVLTPVPGQLQPALVDLRAQILDRHADVTLAQVRVDTGGWQPLSIAADGRWGLRLAGLPDGTHSLVLRARDRWGNESQSEPLAFDVDASAPLIAIAGVAEGALTNQPVTPTITISDAHLDTAQTHVRLNGQDYVSGTAITADGEYTIAVRAVDTAGNPSLASRHFTVDRTPPPLLITSPADASVVANGTIVVQVNSEAGAEVTVNVGAYQAVATAGANGQAQFAAVPLVEGLNRIEAVARDAAGNVSALQAVNVRYEATAALPLIGTLQPAQAELAHGEDLVVALQLRNPGDTALALQSLRLRVLAADGTPLAQRDYARAFTAGESFSDTPQFATTSWPLGTLDLQLDLLVDGSWRRLAAQSLRLVDRTPPQLQAVAPQAGAVIAAPLRLRATASDALSAPVTVEASIDDGASTALDSVTSPADTFESTSLALADGVHHYALRARDAAGNEATVSAVAFTVDSTPPQIAIAGVADGDLLNHAVTPLIQVSDAHPRTTTVRLNGQPYVSGTPVEHSGDYTLRVDADDEAGNGATRAIAFTIDLDAPAVLVTEPVPDSTVTSAAQTIAGTTEPLADVAVDAPGLTTVVRADASGTFRTAAATLVPGANTVRLRATDRAGNVGPERLVQVRYQPPTGEALSAQFLHGALSLRRGDPLTVSYRLHNDSATALKATPLRVQLRDAAGDIVAQQNEALNLGVGAEALREATFATAALVVGPYRVEIIASLRDAQGQTAWIAIADLAAALRQGCPPERPADRLFGDGFGDAIDDALFCNGFEPATKSTWSAVPDWLSHLFAPARPSLPANAGDRS